MKTVLNVGCGELSSDNLHPAFKGPEWRQVRFDIDAGVNPDIQGSLTQLDSLCEPASFDAIWCSHSLEHLYAHEVAPSLRNMRQALRPDGYAVITCPDVDAIVAEIADKGMDQAIYQSDAGPINALDMLFGHTVSIAEGNVFMAHRTGFTSQRLANALLFAGFGAAVMKRRFWDLWALGVCRAEDADRIRGDLARTSLDFFV